MARWPNALIAAAAVVVSAAWVGAARWRAPALAALAAVALTVTANAWNDAADLEIDRIAHPRRPIPAGRLTIRQARALALCAAVAGVALSFLALPALGWISLGAVMVMLSYSPWLKRLGLAGNIVVAILASLPFLYGAAAAGWWREGLALVAVAAPLHLARELTKDLDDAPGDARLRRTLPVTIGAATTRRLAAAALVLFVLAALALAVGRPRLALALIPAIALSAWAGAIVLGGRRGGAQMLKLAMLCAIAGLAVTHA